MTRRYYSGPPDQQPQDCGRKHPQPLCMCVMCEIAARFDNIAKLQKHRELLRAIREIDDPTPGPRVAEESRAGVVDDVNALRHQAQDNTAGQPRHNRRRKP